MKNVKGKCRFFTFQRFHDQRLKYDGCQRYQASWSQSAPFHIYKCTPLRKKQVRKPQNRKKKRKKSAPPPELSNPIGFQDECVTDIDGPQLDLNCPLESRMEQAVSNGYASDDGESTDSASSSEDLEICVLLWFLDHMNGRTLNLVLCACFLLKICSRKFPCRLIHKEEFFLLLLFNGPFWFVAFNVLSWLFLWLDVFLAWSSVTNFSGMKSNS